MSIEIPEYATDLDREGYHRAWFTMGFFAAAEANGYTRVVDRSGHDIMRNGDGDLKTPALRAWLFEKPISRSLPAAKPPSPTLVATLRPGDTIVALTIWKDHVVLATTTGVYIMADQATGFVPMKVTYEEKPDPNPDAKMAVPVRRAGFHIHWFNDCGDGVINKAISYGFRRCLTMTGAAVRRCVGQTTHGALYAEALEIEEDRWPAALEEMQKW